MPPECGYPTAGGGVRAWSLGKALEAAGHKVLFSIEKSTVEGKNLPEHLTRYAFELSDLDDAVNRSDADVLLFEQWWPLSFLKRTDLPVILDIPGPLILENSFRNIGDIRTNASAKLRALQKADFYLYTTPRQRYYWIPWLALAGVDPREMPFGLVPICLSPDIPEAQLGYRAEPDREMRFIQGGVFWAWQDSSSSLNRILRTMEEKSQGELLLIGGKHPFHDVPGQEYLDPRDSLAQSERWKIQPMCPLKDLIEEYSHGGVAVDLMQPNVERELSCAVRDITYLWCGLPLVVYNYSYLADDLLAYDAGWIIDPDRPEELEAVVTGILGNPSVVVAKSKNAQRLVSEKFTWNNAVAPLLDFCNNPGVREKKRHYLQHMAEYIDSLTGSQIPELKQKLHEAEKSVERIQKELDFSRKVIRDRDNQIGDLSKRASEAEASLHALRSKLPFKIYKRIMKLFGMD